MPCMLFVTNWSSVTRTSTAISRWQTKKRSKSNWEQLKLQEGKKSVLAGVPRSLPAMVKAYRMQEKTKQVGFEWENEQQVWEKVEEEIAEFKATAVDGVISGPVEEEFGDVLFSLINYARFERYRPRNGLGTSQPKVQKAV
jgi:XTP/dITP diphosphohydrolase